MDATNRMKSWSDLEGMIAPVILHAPKTGGDPRGDWPAVHSRIAGYLARHVVGVPWANHLALAAAVLAARQYDVVSIKVVVNTLHVRLKELFQALSLKTMSDFDAEHHIPLYLKGEILPDAQPSLRERFWIHYSTAAKQVWLWLETLPSDEKDQYQAFAFSVIPHLAVVGLVKHKEMRQQQRQKRKTETDAIVPHFAVLRAQAHLRYNRLVRLRQAYHEALEQCQRDALTFPVEFSYEEGTERWSFRLWDRRSFVLSHSDRYNRQTVTNALEQVRGFTQDRNLHFIELIHVTRLSGDAPPQGPWFTDLLRLGVLGDGPICGSEERVKEKQAWLGQWGYVDDRGDGCRAPFQANTSGLLCWSHDEGDASFMARAQARTDGILIPVGPLYAAASFGLLALDMFTTTGLRINELMQARLSRDCLVRLVDDPPPGAKDRSPRIRYLFRLIPKGEKTNTPRNYFIAKETLRLVEKTGRMLKEHYQLENSEPLPAVAFSPTNGRAHRFEAAPYLFQYRHHHLDASTITACMRFLLHGMIFETKEGKPVILKAHLLRHAFATYAVQVAQVPVDIVAEWLKQKDLEVTRYYSQVPESMVAEEHGTLVARLALQVNIRETILRSPQEMQQQIEQAKRSVGTLISVTGGECTLDGRCPSQFACIGCSAKVPDPAKRYQIEHMKQRAKEKLAYCQQEGLVLEVERLTHLLHHCEAELNEMLSIEHYQEDERYGPHIVIKSREG